MTTGQYTVCEEDTDCLDPYMSVVLDTSGMCVCVCVCNTPGVAYLSLT